MFVFLFFELSLAEDLDECAEWLDRYDLCTETSAPVADILEATTTFTTCSEILAFFYDAEDFSVLLVL